MYNIILLTNSKRQMFIRNISYLNREASNSFCSTFQISQSTSFTVTKDEMICARSFPPDQLEVQIGGLRLQHFKDHISPAVSPGIRQNLVSAPTCFCTLAFSGDLSTSHCPFFSGTTLIALTNEGGIRSIV